MEVTFANDEWYDRHRRKIIRFATYVDAERID